MLSMEMQSAHLSHGIGSLPSSLTHHVSTIGTHHHHHNNHTHHLHRQHHNHPHSSNSSISNNNNTTTGGQHTQPHHVQHLQHLDSSSIMQSNSNDHCHTQTQQQQLTQLQTPHTLTYDVKPKVHKLDEYCLTSNGNTITTNTSTGSTAQMPTNFMPQTAVEWITVMNENHNNAEDSHSSQGSISGDGKSPL